MLSLQTFKGKKSKNLRIIHQSSSSAPGKIDWEMECTHHFRLHRCSYKTLPLDGSRQKKKAHNRETAFIFS